MLSRRQLLASTLGAPSLCITPEVEILCEDTLLGEESAAGYRLHGQLALRRRVVVLAGLCNPSERTLNYVQIQLRRGSLVILESGLGFCSQAAIRKQAERLNRHFATNLHARCITPERYIRYIWPHPLAIRSFGPALSISCAPNRVFAASGDTPVATRKLYQGGELLFVGAPLGPALFAGDREAYQLWRTLLVRCAGRSCAGTSTTA